MKVEQVPFGNLFKLARRTVVPKPGLEYTEIGIRSFGKGIFIKEPVTGQSLGSKRVFTVESGDFVVSNVFAWEGAVGLATDEHHGLIGSHRFMTWVPRDAGINVSYVLEYFRSRVGVAALAAASPGSAGRNRTLAIKNLEAVVVPVPGRDAQDRIAAHLETLVRAGREASRGSESAEAVFARLREVTFDRLTERGTRSLRTVLRAVDQTEAVDPDSTYSTLGVRAWGRGAFESGTTLGSKTSYKRLRRFEAGQVCYPKLMGWQGAFTVIPDELDGYYSSPEFVGFEVDGQKASGRYLDHLFRWSHFVRSAAGMATGTNANRRRLQPGDFLNLEVPLPSCETQIRVAASLDLAASAVGKAREVARLATALAPAARSEIFESTRTG